jgi:hypothetical protein
VSAATRRRLLLGLAGAYLTALGATGALLVERVLYDRERLALLARLRDAADCPRPEAAASPGLSARGSD